MSPYEQAVRAMTEVERDWRGPTSTDELSAAMLDAALDVLGPEIERIYDRESRIRGGGHYGPQSLDAPRFFRVLAALKESR